MIAAMRVEEKESLLHVKDQDPETERIVIEMNVKDQIQGKGQPIVGQRTVTKSFKGTIFIKTNTENNTETNTKTNTEINKEIFKVEVITKVKNSWNIEDHSVKKFVSAVYQRYGASLLQEMCWSPLITKTMIHKIQAMKRSPRNLKKIKRIAKRVKRARSLKNQKRRNRNVNENRRLPAPPLKMRKVARSGLKKNYCPALETKED